MKRTSEFENAGKKHFRKSIVTKISKNARDSWFLLNDGNVACVLKKSGNNYECGLLPKNELENLFTKPCESRLFGIYFVSQKNMSWKRKLLSSSEFKRKLTCFCFGNDNILVELLSCTNFRN